MDVEDRYAIADRLSGRNGAMSLRGLARTCIHIGAGPSLDEQLQKIRMYQVTTDMTIFCSDAALSCLLNASPPIWPDYVVTSEEGEDGRVFFAFSPKRNPKGPTTALHPACRLIASNLIHPEVVKAWKEYIGGPVYWYTNWQDRQGVRGRWDGMEIPGPRIVPLVQNVIWQSIAVARFLGYSDHVLYGVDHRCDFGRTHHKAIPLNPIPDEASVNNRFAVQVNELRMVREREPWKLEGIRVAGPSLLVDEGILPRCQA